MLKNAPTIAIRNMHTAENEPCEVRPLYGYRSPRYMACYSDQIEDASTLKLAMNTCKAYVGLTHPCKEAEGGFMPDLKYRYLSEDVPTGLCFSKGLAEILEVPSPTMDKVMMWAQECIGLEIMVDGKMCGKDIAKTRAPQGMGITTAEDFIAKAQLA